MPRIIVQNIDQRRGDPPPVDSESSRGPNGEIIIRNTIRDTTRDLVEGGELDRSMNSRFGLRPALG